MSRRLLVATSTYPRWEGDTHPRFVHDLCAHLTTRHDVEVHVLAPMSHGAARHEVVDGVEVHRFAYWRDRPDLLRDGPALPTLKAHPTTALQVPTYLAALGRAIRAELTSGRWDAVHAHWVAPQATVAALAGAGNRRGGPRLVGTSHGSDVLGLGRAGTPLLRWTLRRLDAFTGVSEAVVQRARELGLPRSTPTHVAPMGIDTRIFRPDEDAGRDVRQRHAIPDDAPLVLSAGRLVPGKGVDVLLDALPRVRTDHPDVHVAVVGHGAARDDLEVRARNLGVADAITFHGFVPHSELAGWYAAADVLVSPSRSEGFGLVYAEALASGCPVVASDLPAVREITADHPAATLVPVDDPSRLATAIDDHLARRAAHRAAALRRAGDVAARFGWDAATDRHAEVLFG